MDVAEMNSVTPKVALILRKERDPELQPIDRKPQIYLVLVLAPHCDRRSVKSRVDALVIIASDLPDDPSFQLPQRHSRR
jgi:hypothetical protein